MGNGGRGTIAALVLCLGLGIHGCGGDSSSTSQSELPVNPADWVCADPQGPLSAAEVADWCEENEERGLPADLLLPPPLSELAEKNAYELEVLQPFLRDRVYADLGWKHDPKWRFTGPYVGTIGSGRNYGVHPVVRIYYSPEVIDWLCAGRPDEIPDGAIIVKEMHSIEPCLDVTLDGDGCMTIQADPPPDDWTVMIKAKQGSHDGWYWGAFSRVPSDPPDFIWKEGNPPILDRSAITTTDFYANSGNPPASPDPLWYPTGYVFEDRNKQPDVVTPFSEYGGHCINCHASAAVQSTFTSLENIVGGATRYKGFSFAAGRCEAASESVSAEGYEHVPGVAAQLDELQRGVVAGYVSPFSKPLPSPHAGFTEFYDQISPVSFAGAWELRLPAETYDHVESPADAPQEFLTSDQCAPCHDATISNSALPNMVFRHEQSGRTDLVNLSPYGEWKASPMGLAGRDPIFFAQLQSETNIQPAAMAACIENTCLHCHGVMGQRQLAIDTQGQDEDACKQIFGIEPPPEVPFGRAFRRAMVTQWPGSEPRSEQEYGALARDGISCAVCHRASAQALGQERTYTGNFVTGRADQMFGPYEDDTIAPESMKHALGIEPKYGEQMLESDTCGACHNILLPVLDNAGNVLGHSYEQATHLEWVNSVFGPNRSEFLSCQDCHMPTTFAGVNLRFPIANIESNLFAPTTFRLPDDEIELTERARYPRHALHGLNVFLNQMFQQFPLILGYRQINYGTGTLMVPPLITGLDSMLQMAANDTASVAVAKLEKTSTGKLHAVVEVTNKVGHSLPSGVGFRRLILEFLVKDAQGRTLWASGRTNDLGAILEGRGERVLPSEKPVPSARGQCAVDPDAPFEPHHQIVEREDQVQIYQELVKDSDGVLTTSFLRRVDEVKDNRLRPKGFDPAMFASSPSPYIRALAELHGEERFDPHYYDPKLTGSDEIEYVASLDPGDLERVDHVEVAIYSQSIPPFYLQQRFRDANCGAGASDDIERLYHITSHLNLGDSGSTAQWKLRIAGAAKKL